MTLACALLALGLRPSTGVGTLVGSGSADARATAVDAHRFGGDAVVVLVHEPLTELLETGDLKTVSELEACLAGEQLRVNRGLGAYAPVSAAGARPYGGAASPCGELMRRRPAQVVYGPGTFLSRAVAAVNSQIALLGAAARTAIADAEHTALALATARGLTRSQAQAAATAAGTLEEQSQAEQLAGLAAGSGLGTEPAIDNPAFIERIVFGAGASATPKPRLLLPVPVVVGGVDPGPPASWAVAERGGRGDRSDPPGGRDADVPAGARRHVSVSGEPVVLDDLGGAITRSIVIAPDRRRRGDGGRAAARLPRAGCGCCRSGSRSRRSRSRSG